MSSPDTQSDAHTASEAVGPVGAGARLEAVIAPVVEDLGLTLYDVELTSRRGRAILMVTVENPAARDRGEGITVAELVETNRELSAVLDVEDPIAGRYDLEVQSPGVERALTRKRHYELSVGDPVHVVFTSLVAGNSVVDGVLTAADDAGIRVLRSRDEVEVIATYGMIKSANTVYDWKATKGSKRGKKKNK